MHNRLVAEEGARAAADASLETKMDAADLSLTTRLAAEEAARLAGDNSIDVVMAAIQADVDQNEADADAQSLLSKARYGC